jgi:hypothetical protein
VKRGWLINAGLALAVALLGWLAHLAPSGGPPSYALSTLRSDQVTTIQFERRGRPAVTLEKRAGTWLITAPFLAPADPFQVQRFLVLPELKSGHRFAPGTAERFGLTKPSVRVSLNGERFAFGIVNSVTREQYVRAGDQIYTIEARYGANLPGNPGGLIRKRLFGEDEVPVRFELPGFDVTQSEGMWRVSAAKDTSQDDLARWVEGWRDAAALRVEPYEKDEAKTTVRITLRDGRRVRLRTVEHDSGFAIERSDLGLRYHFAADVGRRLLALPGTMLEEK